MPRLATLHVAALPYPTSQGTQAAIGCMVAALAQEGRSTALLTYARGDGRETRFEHRVTAGRIQPRSLRSGPSLEKLAADAELALALRSAARDADVVIAHHVEAAALALALRLPRWVFVAHTTLGPELPTYLPRALAPIAARSGRALDRLLARRAPAVAAISKHVQGEIRHLTGRHATVLPVPVPIPGPAPRAPARRALGLAEDDEVVLYAGNLDAYQGLDVLVEAARRLQGTRPRFRLLVATESSTAALASRFAAHGIAPRFTSLATETDRASVHAAADLAVVTRGTPGGFPIKLLDAVARGVPVVAMRRALSGESFPGVALADDDGPALAAALARALDARHDTAPALAHLRAHHGSGALVRALDTLVARLQIPER